MRLKTAEVGLSVPICTKVQFLVPRHLSRDPIVRFPLNFSESKMAVRQIICVSLGKFLCAKFEISLQTQEN